MATLTSPIGITYRAITQYELFKTLIEFYTGEVQTDSDIATIADKMFTHGTPISGWYNSGTTTTYEADKTVVNFTFPSKISDNKYWIGLKNLGYISDVVYDLGYSGTNAPFIFKDMSTGQLVPEVKCDTPYDTTSMKHNWLKSNLYLKIDVGGDSELASNLNIKTNSDPLVYYNNWEGILWRGTGQTFTSTSSTFTHREDSFIFCDKSLTFVPFLYVTLSGSTDIVVDGSATVYGDGTEWNCTHGTGFPLTISANKTGMTVDNLPTKIEINLPIKQNVNWIIFDLNDLYGESPYNLSEFVFGDDISLDVMTQSTSYKDVYNLVGTYTGSTAMVVENTQYVDVHYTVFDYNSSVSDGLVRINPSHIVNNKNGYPMIQLNSGLWLIFESFYVNESSTPSRFTWDNILTYSSSETIFRPNPLTTACYPALFITNNASSEISVSQSYEPVGWSLYVYSNLVNSGTIYTDNYSIMTTYSGGRIFLMSFMITRGGSTTVDLTPLITSTSLFEKRGGLNLVIKNYETSDEYEGGDILI